MGVEGDVEGGSLGQMYADAKASDEGCCICTCKGCFICQCAGGWYDCCTYSKYRAPAAIFCEYCLGEHATYGRRTFWSICFIPFLFILAFLLLAEAAVWSVVILLCICLSVCVIVVLAGMSGRRR